MTKFVPRVIRWGYVCTHKDCIPPRRVTLASEKEPAPPKCPDHGTTMVKYLERVT